MLKTSVFVILSEFFHQSLKIIIEMNEVINPKFELLMTIFFK